MLGDAFRGRDAVKEYWALVTGVPSPRQGTINQALTKTLGKEGYEKVVADPSMGKPAKTEYRVIEAAGRKAAWLLLKPWTGRTHQLRVHCAGMGTPISGDFKYGGKQAILDGTPSPDSLHLHAQSIVLPHPSGGELAVTAPLPEKLQKSWEFFGFDINRQEAR
jgi:23S rRNA pseudouridine955/2504/2580 synthase